MDIAILLVLAVSSMVPSVGGLGSARIVPLRAARVNTRQAADQRECRQRHRFLG
jgi:hypothetical protein